MHRTRRLAATALVAPLILPVGFAPACHGRCRLHGPAVARRPHRSRHCHSATPGRRPCGWPVSSTRRASSRPRRGRARPISPPPPRACWPCRRPTWTCRWPGPPSTYLQSHVDQYVTAEGADGPGQLALLILDAEALGANPQAFGGTDLVARLLATEQTSGPDAGLFGTEAQAADFSAGGYQQGLALAALAAAGVKSQARRARPSPGWSRSSAPTAGGRPPTTPTTPATACRPTSPGRTPTRRP